MLHISNEQLLSSVNKAIESRGLSCTMQDKRWSDHRMLLRLTFDGDEVLGSEVFRKQLYLFNLNDGNHALRMFVGLFRLVCSNGLVIPAYEDSAHTLRIIHRDCGSTHDKLAKLPQLITDGLDAIAGFGDVIQETKEIPVSSDEQAFQIIGNLNVSDNVKDVSMRHWLRRAEIREADAAPNAWSLYNVVNERIRYVHGSMSQVALRANATLLNDVQSLALDAQSRAA